ncbi:hypothetical protein [Brevibacillus porteri]|uniref:hypothetical protein n=1 Tax=Brevibacillus porteri TaxID=2126350 RepID=UPI002E1A5D9F|nr:hypothetical protein [Brevibacillus porteri]MED2895013.1 hypothetical protein [Brevibacillus porteri]
MILTINHNNGIMLCLRKCSRKQSLVINYFIWKIEMWVDEKTGVLLKLITTDKGGNVKNSIEVLNINFETNLAKTTSRMFDTDDTKGYKELKLDDKKPSDKKHKK